MYYLMISDLRFELSFKNIPQLENKLNFCKFNKITDINIPCKGLIKKDFLNSTIKYISKNYQEFNVTYHYSLYHQFSQNKEKSYQDFMNFLKNLKDLDMNFLYYESIDEIDYNDKLH